MIVIGKDDILYMIKTLDRGSFNSLDPVWQRAFDFYAVGHLADGPYNPMTMGRDQCYEKILTYCCKKIIPEGANMGITQN